MGNKPYITKKVIITEILGFVFLLVGTIVSIVINNPEQKAGRIILAVIMLGTGATMSLILHFLPVSAWNMPVKVNPNKALIVYEDCSFMLALCVLEFGIYTLFFELTVGMGDVIATVATTIFSIAIVITILASVVLIIKHNK